MYVKSCDLSKLPGVITMFGTASYLCVNYYSIIFQLMVDGVSGMDGINAPKRVVEALKNEPEPAPTPHLPTRETIARGTLKKHRIATNKPAQVKFF